jgi:rod shape determining protein RodA
LQVQPAELGKMLLVITLAQHLANNYGKINRLSAVLLSLAHIGVPALMVFVQPDLGTASVMFVVWFVMVWAAGLRFKHLALFVSIGLIMLPVLWFSMEEYQQQRIISFISPESDPEAQYNIDQALISIGSGGMMGKGYGNGSQTQGRFLRVRHTDFIFSVIAEEMGFVGATIVIVLMGVVIWRCLRGAAVAADAVGSLICYGVAGMVFFQTMVSIGMNLNILPVTGLTLPFVSSGGSSLVTMLIGIGLVESVVIRRRLREYT